MIVRYFAGAAEAAGRTEQSLPGELTVAEVKAQLATEHGPAFDRVLTCCSLLVDGVRAGDETYVATGSTVDVLPPFAGG